MLTIHEDENFSGEFAKNVNARKMFVQLLDLYIP